MQRGPYVPIQPRSKPQQRKESPFPLLIIVIAFSFMLLGTISDFMAHQKEMPDSEDFSSEGYQEALDEYYDSVQDLEAISSLLLLCGTIGLGAGLFFYAAEASSHLPDYARAALMLGAMYYLVRMATSEISIADMLTIFDSLS